ncbi:MULTISPECIES: hypothetical protein [Dyella]|uniref:Uncharacterized protein n=2 Tax=Dyella TaxID=231454 RepID=A0A4V2NMD0_9GAMM|nr:MULTISPECIES: hypothetical protein [Dyella]TBR39621.1 hypothetical protein EYV96_05320 [Dyella terrae]TCI12797.1 hypothetical protein EZM97_05550 [Dyella soli]
MNEVLQKVKAELEHVVSALESALPNDEPLGNIHNNWSFPGLTRAELAAEAESIVELIDEKGVEDLGDAESKINDYVRRLAHLRGQTIPNMWSNAGLAVPAYMLTLQGLRNVLAPALVRDLQSEASEKLRKTTQQLRGLEARLKSLEPKSISLTSMVERIEKAYEAADQLPTDLESLSDARQQISDLLLGANEDIGLLSGLRDKANAAEYSLSQSSQEAIAVLQRCETAYSAATSVGLAAAFNERSDTLSKSMWVWVLGLLVALGAGSYFGSHQLHALSDLIKLPSASSAVIILNLLLSLLSVGAPVWFAWLATKQIGQRFRLAEDYAFKASISRAYEGFRREAARFDKDMEARLLASALNRLDELPLRLVETETHGSPWHELLSSSAVKEALRVVPGFAEQMKDFAGRALSVAKTIKTAPAAAAAAAVAGASEDPE